jgi:hypothetical protein
MEIPSRTVTEYLIASGVVAICTIRLADGVLDFRLARDLGKLAMGGVEIVCVHWLAGRQQAAKVMRNAKKIAKGTRDEVCAHAALHSAAILNGAHLTPHRTVLARTESAARRLAMRVNDAAVQGQLKLFNAEFRRRRLLATARGEGFMNYATARRRFRRVIIGRLIVSGATQQTNLYDEVFREG